ncbi:hypothetical protein EGW08_002188, partial [Elysia chlorotica]
QVYKRRWYILILFSLVCFTQGLMWNTFGPISTSSERVFGWGDPTIAWLSALGGLSFLITSFPVYWLMQVKGERGVTELKGALGRIMDLYWEEIAMGVKWRIVNTCFLINLGQFIAGFATPVSMGACPTLSATWFPQDERVTATAISASIGVFGVASAFVLGKVKPCYIRVIYMYFNPPYVSCIIRLMFSLYPLTLECGWAGLLFLAIVCYFPNTPPCPPSISAFSERHTFWAGLRSLFRNRDFVIISLTYGFTAGVFGAWQSVLTVNLKPAGISQDEAGWLGFYSVVSGCLASVLVGRFADRFLRHMKLFILVMYTLATACFIVFSLELFGPMLPHSEGLLYASVICGGTLLLGATPLMFELGCEIGYPASESAANGMFALFNNLTGVTFMIPFAIPHIGTMWMNWVFVGFCLASLPLVAVVRSSFNRLNLDEEVRQ